MSANRPTWGPHLLRRRELIASGAVCAGAALAGSVVRVGPALPQRDKELGVPFHLGLVTYNVAKDWDLDVLLGVCHDAGLDGIEFRTTHAHGVEPTLTPEQRRSVGERCRAAGMRQLSLGSVCEFHSPDPAVVRGQIDTFRQFASLARDIGARGVKVRPNGLPKEVPIDKTLDQIGKALAECGRIGAEHGVEVWMEVHGGGTSIPGNARKIMDACGHPNVGITWNSNGTDVEEGSIRKSFALLRPFIRCCHITDLWSSYPWRELFGLLRETKFDGYTLCEVGTPMPPDAGRAFMRCYRALWQELGR